MKSKWTCRAGLQLELLNLRSQHVDRLSNLPNHIIQHILSFLDAKYAVQTSVLAKGWRNLWTSVHVLHLNSNSFRRLGRFKKFVVAVLNKLNHNSTAGTFIFSYRGRIDDYLKKRVIYFATVHGIDHLVLDMGCKRPPVSQELLSCQTLKTIKLKNATFTTSFGFSKLTTLHLKHYSRFLKYQDPNCSIYRESHVVDLSVINLPSLQHADVDVFLSYEEENKDIQCLLKFFQGLYNVQSATLSYSTIQALNGVPGLELQQSPFSRLSLKLTHPSDCSFPIPVKVAKYLCNGSPTPDTILVE
ncbi:hypothetical protein OIU85_001994 [Salix viminalis]|uniref:F-box domain-containing protein n=1 Tax=Salix viminalis TaxID=40686 RepID=A0A9Q0VMG3_SALVM|nr:hypothetical protein OIU85_001994 [Salix viminalis]